MSLSLIHLCYPARGAARLAPTLSPTHLTFFSWGSGLGLQGSSCPSLP